MQALLPTNLASGISGGENTVPRKEEQALTKIVSATNAANASNAEVQRRRDGRFPFDPILFSEKNSIAALATSGTFADHPLAPGVIRAALLAVRCLEIDIRQIDRLLIPKQLSTRINALALHSYFEAGQ